MNKVLIPFTDPESGERAIRQLLEERSSDGLEVTLVAIAEAPELHHLRRFVSPASADEAARSAAICWLAKLTPVLEAANVPYHTEIVVGRPRAEIEAALHRADVDRVLLPSTAPRWTAAAPLVTLTA
jgi:hypothetical protein